jgi:PAS domain-containing protein
MPAPFPPVLDAPGDASSTVAMATFDVDLVCTYANPAFQSVLGTGDACVRGMAWEALFPALSPSQQAIVAAVATDGPPVGEVDVTVAVT